MGLHSYRGVSDHRPLSTTEMGFLLAGTTLAAPFAGPVLGLGAAGGRGFHILWRFRPFAIPFAFSPRGGGPGQSLTSTNPRDRLHRGYQPSHGY